MQASIYINTTTLSAHSSTTSSSCPSVVARLQATFEATVYFFEDGEEAAALSSPTFRFVLKEAAKPTGDVLVLDTSATTNGVGYVFTFASVDSNALRTLLADNESVDCMGEIEWTVGAVVERVHFPVLVQNAWVQSGDEAPDPTAEASWDWLKARVLAGSNITRSLDEDANTMTLAASGDMVLASVQSVTGLKTFDTTKLAIKGSSTGTTAIASANAGASNYTATLPAATGTVALTSDLSSYATTAAVAAGYQPLDSQLTSIAALVDAAGVLTNNGSGTMSYTATSEGGNGGVVDGGKIPKFSGGGGLSAGALTIVDGADDQNRYMVIGRDSFIMNKVNGSNFSGQIGALSLTNHRQWYLPNASGTFAFTDSNISGTAAGLSSTLAVASGGTGLTALGTALQVLRTNAGATAMEWATITAGSGTVTSVSTAGTVNGLTLTGGPITESGTITLGGTLSGISPSAITGTAAILGANTFTALQTIDLDSVTQLKVIGDISRASGTVPAVLLEENSGGGITTFSGSTSGTMLGINVESSFAGNFLDFRTNNAQNACIASSGSAMFGNTAVALNNNVVVWNAGGIGWTSNSGVSASTTPTTAFYYEAAGTIQMGADAAGVVTPQTFKACDRITSDGVGADLIIAGGRNRGASDGGSVIIQTSPTAGAGVTGTLTTRVTVNADGITTFAKPAVLPSYTVAGLPATAANGAVQGAHAFVTDATAPTYLGALTGGGAVVCPVFYNGSAWVSH